jgi:integrase/recombinase XerD
VGLEQNLRNPSRDDVLRALGIDPTLYVRLVEQDLGVQSESRQSSLPMNEAIQLFASRRLVGHSWTARTYMTVLKSFQAFVDQRTVSGTARINQITGADIAAFTTRPRQDGARRHPNSINRDLAILSAFFGFHVREGHLRRNPAELAERAPEPQSAPRALSEEEQQRLLDWSRRSYNGLRNYTILHLALSTGLRASEVCNLNWADVDLCNGLLHVVRGKGGRDRTVPLLQPVIDSLQYYRQSRRYEVACPGFEDAVFLNSTGPRWGCAMTVDGLEVMIRPLLRRLRKPKGCSFHILRHSFAVNLLWRGVHIAVIGALLGHRSFETTNKYLRLGDPAMKEALTNACPDGVLVPAIRREINRAHLSSLVATVFEEDDG